MAAWYLPFLLCFNVVSAESPASSAIEQESLYQRATAHAQNGQTEAAVACFTELLSRHPCNVSVLWQRAEVYCRAGRWKEALADANESLRLDGDCLQAYCLRGAAHAQLGNSQAAMADFDRVLARAPDFPMARVLRATLLVSEGQLQRAIADYTAALDRDPRDRVARRGRAVCYRRLSLWKETADDCSALLSATPDDREFRFVRGHAYLMSRRSGEALDDFDRVIRDEPRHERAWAGRAAALAQLDRFSEALSASEQALKIAPTSAEAHFVLGAALTRRYFNNLANALPSDLSRARSALDYAIVADPSLHEALVARVPILLQQGLYADAAADVRRAVELDPLNEVVLCDIAAGWLRRKNLAAARAVAEAIRAQNPRSVGALCLCGSLALRDKDKARAMAHFGRALEIDPTCTFAKQGRKAASEPGQTKQD